MCSTSRFRASRSPAAHRSRYSRSFSADRGLGNDPAEPDRRRDRNRLLHNSSSAADSIRIAPFAFSLCRVGLSVYGRKKETACAVSFRLSKRPLAFLDSLQ